MAKLNLLSDAAIKKLYGDPLAAEGIGSLAGYGRATPQLSTKQLSGLVEALYGGGKGPMNNLSKADAQRYGALAEMSNMRRAGFGSLEGDPSMGMSYKALLEKRMRPRKGMTEAQLEEYGVPHPFEDTYADYFGLE